MTVFYKQCLLVLTPSIYYFMLILLNVDIFYFLFLDIHCSDETPSTQTFAVGSMGIKPTTKPTTVRIETTQLTSTIPPSPTELSSTQTPSEPDLGYLEKEKEESSATRGI